MQPKRDLTFAGDFPRNAAPALTYFVRIARLFTRALFSRLARSTYLSKTQIAYHLGGAF